jgi:hypothetical protein
VPPAGRLLVVLLLAVGVAGALRASRPAAAGSRTDALAEVDGARYRMPGAGSSPAGARTLPADVQQASLTFDAGVAPADRAAVLGAIAGARPEAQRLIGLVDGLVEINVAGTGPRALGVTYDHGGSYGIVLDLPRVLATYGERGVDRVVLHELGHVVDAALVPEQLDAALDAQMPPGYACPPGERTSACAPRAERFAETFAKWATGDIGVNLNVGYAVAPPVVALDRWGEPLAALGEDSGQ